MYPAGVAAYLRSRRAGVIPRSELGRARRGLPRSLVLPRHSVGANVGPDVSGYEDQGIGRQFRGGSELDQRGLRPDASPHGSNRQPAFKSAGDFLNAVVGFAGSMLPGSAR